MIETLLQDASESQSSTRPIRGFITSFDKTRLAFATFAKENPAALLIFFHGSGAHGLAGYTLFAEQLHDQYQIATYLIDLRGHGRSDGIRGHTEFKEFVWRDISSCIQFLKKKFGDKPIFLGGHSISAGLLLNYWSWQEHLSIEGYIMVAPEFGFHIPLKHESAMGKFLNIQYSAFFLNNITAQLRFGDLIAMKFGYTDEHLKRFGLISSYTVNMSNALTPKNPLKLLEKIDISTYILIAGRDEFFDANKIERYLSKIIQKNKNILLEKLENARHFSILKYSVSRIGKFILSNSIVKNYV